MFQIEDCEINETGRYRIYAVILKTLKSQERSFGQISDDPKIVDVVHKYSELFRTTLPDELPPKRSADREIETDANKKIPNRWLFKLSFEGFRATRECIEENVRCSRIRLSKSPYGAFLFFAK